MLTWAQILGFANGANPHPPRRVEKSDAEWRDELTPEAYRVTRQAATERPFSSELCSLFEPGRYACVCCGTELFDASGTFESGTGWPSFTGPVDEDVVAYRADRSHGMHRVETLYNVCDAHLGHVFPDGPRPTGLRFCINAVALKKVDDDDR
jgi:peptide-methionine (R)-S-oxide reductase